MKRSPCRTSRWRLPPGRSWGCSVPMGRARRRRSAPWPASCGRPPGRLSIRGCDIAADPVAAKQQLAFVPDDPRLFDSLTVWEHLEFIAAAYRVPDFAAAAEPLLEQFELTEKRNTVARELSRGMRQKVAICCAYLHRPAAILFDEPLTGLDPRGIRTLKDSIRQRAAAGAAVIVSSHCCRSSKTSAPSADHAPRTKPVPRHDGAGRRPISGPGRRELPGSRLLQGHSDIIGGQATSSTVRSMHTALWKLFGLRIRGSVRAVFRRLKTRAGRGAGLLHAAGARHDAGAEPGAEPCRGPRRAPIDAECAARRGPGGDAPVRGPEHCFIDRRAVALFHAQRGRFPLSRPRFPGGKS